MVPNKIPNVDPAGQPQQTGQGPEKAGDSAEFRRMLERLEAIAKKTDGSHADVDKVQGTEAFMDAMKKADEDFITAMDLRRKLEEAYRRNQP